MALFITWLFFSVISGVIAGRKGRWGFGFFLLSVLLSPLIGVAAALLAAPNIELVESKQIASGESKKCPYCAELIKSEAIVCRFCGRDQHPATDTTSNRESPARQGRFENQGKYCPHCKRAIAEPRASDTANFARFWRGECPECGTPLSPVG
jgi:hypothetical protein